MAGRQSKLRVRRGLTLIELVVVLAIVFILVTLLLPSLSKSRERATVVVCMSNLRQFGTVGQTYLSDNDGYFPRPEEWLYRAESYNSMHPKGCRWHDREMALDSEIMRTNEAYQGAFWREIIGISVGPCPTFRQYGAERGCNNPNHPHELDIDPQNSYSINGYLGGTGPGSILRLSQARGASDVFFFAEENAWIIANVSPYRRYFKKRSGYAGALSTTALDDTVLVITPSPDVKGCFATYHATTKDALEEGESNAAFLDGHVDRIVMEEQLRRGLNHGDSKLGPAGNLHWAWASSEEPPGGWDKQ